MRISIVFQVFVFLSALPCISLMAQTFSNSNVSKPMENEEYSGGPLCGVYAVFGALKANKYEPRLLDLAQPRYVGSPSGSSLRELAQAVEDSGADAKVFVQFSIAALQSTEHPVILHVRRPGKNAPFAHWILFLGDEQGMARIQDAPNPVQTISYAELASLWDGIGLVVARPESYSHTLILAWLGEHFASVLLATLLLASCFWAFNKSRAFAKFQKYGFIVPLATGLIASLVWHCFHPVGFMTHREAVAQVALRHFDPRIPTIDRDRAKELIDSGAIVVDARYARDYGYGHLPGALNLPINSGLLERNRFCSKLSKDRPIVVYCQSISCEYDEFIASDLSFRGFSNIVIYSGGYADWTKRN